MTIGTGEIILIAIVALAILFFGGSKLKGLSRATGRATGEFQKGKREVEMELEKMGKKKKKK